MRAFPLNGWNCTLTIFLSFKKTIKHLSELGPTIFCLCLNIAKHICVRVRTIVGVERWLCLILDSFVDSFDDDDDDKEKGETVVWFDLKLWLIKLARWHSNTRSLVRMSMMVMMTMMMMTGCAPFTYHHFYIQVIGNRVGSNHRYHHWSSRS